MAFFRYGLPKPTLVIVLRRLDCMERDNLVVKLRTLLLETAWNSNDFHFLVHMETARRPACQPRSLSTQ